MADQRDAWSEDVSDRILELEHRVRRLRQATLFLTPILVSLVLGGRQEEIGGTAAKVLFVAALAMVPLIVFGGVNLPGRRPTKK